MRLKLGWPAWVAITIGFGYAALWLLALHSNGRHQIRDEHTPISLTLTTAFREADERLRLPNASRIGDRVTAEVDLIEAGVTLTDDMLCNAREYANIREVAHKTLDRDVATNRTYTNENSALVLVRGAEAHVVRLYDPPSHSYHLIADRRVRLRRDNNGSSCAPAGASRIRLSVPVESLVHRPGIELMNTHRG